MCQKLNIWNRNIGQWLGGDSVQQEDQSSDHHHPHDTECVCQPAIQASKDRDMRFPENTSHRSYTMISGFERENLSKKVGG